MRMGHGAGAGAPHGPRPAGCGHHQLRETGAGFGVHRPGSPNSGGGAATAICPSASRGRSRGGVSVAAEIDASKTREGLYAAFSPLR
ncbi:hypothetical protein, partial [Methylobacterium sp. WL116]|uniref:hypothetical protein n=1 Tax=Methylobacterium sp. WL116 TaxID=2603889 RepID=UPI001AED5808